MNSFFEEVAAAYPDVLFLCVDVDDVKVYTQSVFYFSCCVRYCLLCFKIINVDADLKYQPSVQMGYRIFVVYWVNIMHHTIQNIII